MLTRSPAKTASRSASSPRSPIRTDPAWPRPRSGENQPPRCRPPPPRDRMTRPMWLGQIRSTRILAMTHREIDIVWPEEAERMRCRGRRDRLGHEDPEREPQRTAATCRRGGDEGARPRLRTSLTSVSSPSSGAERHARFRRRPAMKLLQLMGKIARKSWRHASENRRPQDDAAPSSPTTAGSPEA